MAHPQDHLAIYVPDEVTSTMDYVHSSHEYEGYCLINEDFAYAWAELEIVGRWQRERQAALDTMPYPEYLLTPEWAARRAARLMIDGWRCRSCNSTERLDVHHRDYTRRGHEDVERDLTTLCRDCHGLFHAGGRMPVWD